MPAAAIIGAGTSSEVGCPTARLSGTHVRRGVADLEKVIRNPGNHCRHRSRHSTMKIRTARLISLIPLLLVVAACGDDTVTSTTSSTVGEEPETTSTTDEAPSDTEASAEVGDVSLTVSGGIAGGYQQVVVEPDGTILYSNATDQQPEPTGETMSADELEALHTTVGSDEFAALESTYVPAGYCCDQFHYEVTAEVDGEEITSATADGIESPDALDEAVFQLNSLL
ncbi:MAG: hypothetical protein EDR02_09860 [Actinobacteria bacterium]|nr:MAG: hypothetical protein EDR02_09860 [Actinomycetota bacterium]